MSVLVLAALLGGARPACPPVLQSQLAGMVVDHEQRIVLILDRWAEALTTEHVACLADHGDKTMMLELAIRLEQGDGVRQDRARAEQLYAAAAKDEVGTIYVYVPPAGKVGGMVMPVRTGPDRPGLPDARFRLARMHIEGRAIKPRPRKGLKWMHQLAKAGYEPARAYLALGTRS